MQSGSGSFTPTYLPPAALPANTNLLHCKVPLAGSEATGDNEVVVSLVKQTNARQDTARILATAAWRTFQM